MTSLSERIEAARMRSDGTAPPGELPVDPELRNWRDQEDEAAQRASDALADFRERAIATLFERLTTRLVDPSTTDAELSGFVREELERIVGQEQATLTYEERKRLIDVLEADALGLGPLQRLMDDPTIDEVMVNGHDAIYVERDGLIEKTRLSFSSEAQLRRVIERIVARVGRRIDESSPMVDARLLDGSRVNAVIPPLMVNGSSLTIRKFSKTPYTVDDLIGFGSMTPGIADLLRACVEARLNILVSGGTGTGKTTLLNVLSSFIPADERIVTIEDAVELKLQQEHVVIMESRPPNIEGAGAVTIRDLVRNSLRMRPDRIVVGEARGGEALDMLQAMNTGHDGSISTLHANSPRDALSRLETMCLMAGLDLPMRAIREQVASAVDLVIQITRLRDGSRRITSITEVMGMEGETIVMQEAFAFDYKAGVDENGRFLGSQVPTGIRPRFTEHFAERGIRFDLASLGSAPGDF